MNRRRAPSLFAAAAEVLPIRQLPPRMKRRNGFLSEYVAAQQRLLFQLLVTWI